MPNTVASNHAQIAVLKEHRAALKTERDRLVGNLDVVLEAAKREQRNLRASESREFDRVAGEIKRMDDELEEVDSRMTELADQAERIGHADEARRISGGWSATPRGNGIYAPNDSTVSFFRDLRTAKLGDYQAAQRLVDNDNEARAMGNTGAAGGAGGEFAPPLWLVDDFVALARAGRVFADRCTKDVLPGGVSSVNIPKITGGTSTAVQSTQNTALSDTDMTTASISSGITSIGGKVVVSQQLLDQSGANLDKIILGDLAADYARSLCTQVISGSGSSGQLNGVYTYFAASGTSNYTYTQATPAVAGAGGFYGAINHAISNVSTNRFLPPTCIVMHPRRWSWVAGSFDGNNRPLVSPSGNAFNQVAAAGTVAAQGPVGEMAGLPVYVDPNIPINLGAGTNQDAVFAMKADDLYLWEAGPTMQSFDAPYADSAGVLFRALGYSAFIPSRYTSSVSVVTGTGLVTPTY